MSTRYAATAAKFSDAELAGAIETTESLIRANAGSPAAIHLKADLNTLKREQESRKYYADPEDGL